MREEKCMVNNGNLTDDNMNKLLDALKTIKYGSVTLIIQDGIVIQIEKNEKIRFR
jgi:hypothetical protein